MMVVVDDADGAAPIEFGGNLGARLRESPAARAGLTLREVGAPSSGSPRRSCPRWRTAKVTAVCRDFVLADPTPEGVH